MKLFKRREKNFMATVYWEHEGKSGFDNVEFSGFGNSGKIVIEDLMKVLEEQYEKVVLISIINVDNIMQKETIIYEKQKEILTEEEQL